MCYVRRGACRYACAKSNEHLLYVCTQRFSYIDWIFVLCPAVVVSPVVPVRVCIGVKKKCSYFSVVQGSTCT